MAKKRQQSKVEAEYRHQRRRIQKYISSMEARGYKFVKQALPAEPKKITVGSVRRLKKITAQSLYGKATYNGQSGVERRKQELKENREAKKRAKEQQQKGTPPAITDMVLSEIEDLIARFPDGSQWTEWEYEIHENHKTTLQRLLNGQITIHGRARVAMRLQKAGQEVVEMAERIIYGDSKDEAYQADLTYFAYLIKGENLTAEEAMEIESLASQYEV